MIKKILSAVICLVLCLSMAACVQDTPNPSGTGASSTEGTSATGSTAPSNKVLPLTEEEKGILEAMGSDINVITDENYIETLGELMNHTSEYVGKVYQLEGCLSSRDGQLQIYRTLVNGSQTMTLGLPLRYLEKDVADGSWIRVTAIVAQGNVDGKTATVLDIVAIEALEKVGQAELPWDGADIHSH